MYSFPLPVRYVDGWAVVALPEEIDLTNAGTVEDTLLALLDGGGAGVVADMTGTRFCGAAGVRAVLRAQHRAQSLDARLGVVISWPAVLKVFRITGTDRLVRICPTVNEALTRSAGDSGRPASGTPEATPRRAVQPEATRRHPVRPPGPVRLIIPSPAPVPSEEQL
jgi:anti-sigma B factor antagonist